MRRTRRAALLASAILWSGLASAQPAAPDLCRPVAFEGARYTACAVDLRRYDLKLFWRGPDGEPYATLANLAKAPGGAKLAMAMNAGMYHADLSPVGLLVEDGRRLKEISTASGPGNFHLKPNGVFFVADGKPGVLETTAFLRAKPRATLATQSGPMLVIGGRLHPRFQDEGPSRKTRNGVGVRDGHVAVFAISDEPVSFGAFARLFRDALGCRDALFLDGSISALHAPGLGRTDWSLKPLGPLIGAVPK